MAGAAWTSLGCLPGRWPWASADAWRRSCRRRKTWKILKLFSVVVFFFFQCKSLNWSPGHSFERWVKCKQRLGSMCVINFYNLFRVLFRLCWLVIGRGVTSARFATHRRQLTIPHLFKCIEIIPGVLSMYLVLSRFSSSGASIALVSNEFRDAYGGPITNISFAFDWNGALWQHVRGVHWCLLVHRAHRVSFD